MTITDERREELIDWLRKAEHPSPADAIWLEPDSARDILAMLREGAAIPDHAAFVSEVKAYMQKASIPPTITFRPYEPPQPETLADVPEDCWCLNVDGVIVWHRDGAWQGISGISGTGSKDKDSDYELSKSKIARVLGYPVLGGGE